jgi:DNA polymerase-3 subunit delta
VQLLDDALAALTRRLFPDAAERLAGREVFDAVETPVDTIVQAAETLPFMTARRLVVVRRCQGLAARDADRLAAYVRAPNPTTCLLLLADEPLAASRERRQDHWLLAAGAAAPGGTRPARGGPCLEGWLRERAAAEGLALSDEAARLLVEWVGDDGARLLGEARKAALAAGTDNRTVGVREVTAVVGEHRLSDVFELTRAVARRDVGTALRTLDRLLATEEPMRLLWLLAGDARAAWGVAQLRARGQTTEQIARALRRPPGAVEAIGRAVGGASDRTLARRLRRCWEVERRLKSSADAGAELAALVADLCAER